MTEKAFRTSVYTGAGLTADVEPAVAAEAGLTLLGVNCRESAGVAAVATFAIVKGATVAGGTRIATIELAANASKSIGFPSIAMDEGITIEVIAGTIDAHVYYKKT